MEAAQVKALVQSAFPSADVAVELSAGHYTVTVIDESFAGLRPVARQQRVYAPLADVIAQGVIHAVNIRALTSAERG
tara:strand:+ start:110 stop:340 length:231 start_codon:yes stop_codon:yes gene_type:complete